MNKRTWLIVGATSIIAEEFARLAAKAGHDLLLLGRHQEQLEVIAADLSLRYRVTCQVLLLDGSKGLTPLLSQLNQNPQEIDLFIAQSFMLNNEELTSDSIRELVEVNIHALLQLIHAYWNKKQDQHRLLFLSSVAATRGRAKNSLYGASKAAIEVYLQGLQQAASRRQQITIARLGFIDTHATYGKPGIFYASPPKNCAKACWKALEAKKRLIYHPVFWRGIMRMMTHLPFCIYKRMVGV